MHNEPAESVVVSVSSEELEKMMERAVQRALANVGLDVAERDDRKEAYEDFRFLRRLRKAMDGTASKVGYAVITVLTGGVLLVLWAGIRMHILKQ